MKTKHSSILVALTLMFAGCYDDSDLRGQIGDIEKDITEINGELSDLKTQLSQINSNIDALQSIADALENNVYVSSVTEIKEQNTQKILGYTIVFTNDEIISIYNGTDGEDGIKGDKGDKGDPGSNGHTPQIGLRLANGMYCWTVDGEFILDAEDKAIPATGTAGEDGKTPELRINEGYWEISYDGQEWEQLGSATGEVTAVDVVFSGVKETSEGVVFILADGSKIVVPRDLPFGLVFEKTTGYEVASGTTTSIAYTVNNSSETTVVDAFASGNWYAEAVMTDHRSGAVKITASEDGRDGKVLVYANDGKGKTDIKTLTFGNGTLSAIMETREIPEQGGNVSISVTSNIDYSIEISDNWLNIAPETRAGETKTETLTLTAGANNSPEQRNAEVKVLDPQGIAVQTFSVTQESGVWKAPTFTCENFKEYVLKYFDTDEDGEISQEEAGNAEEINLAEASYGPVSSLAGIESLYNLKNLKIDTQNASTHSTVTSIDLSSNSRLETIHLQLESLEEININGLRNLKELNIAFSSISNLDLTSLVSLERLYAQSCKLGSIDLSNNSRLTELSVSGTPITELNTSHCPKLVDLTAGSSYLNSLTLDNPTLTTLNLSNGLADNDVDFSSLISLEQLFISNAAVEEINLSNSPSLTYVQGNSFSKLAILDLSAASGLSTFYISGYTNLQTVRLNKAVEGKYTIAGYWKDEDFINPTIEYVSGESVVTDDYTSGISDEYVRKYIISRYDNDGDGKIKENELSSVIELDLSDYGISTSDGLEVFPLEILDISGNELTEFDATAFPDLTKLDISDNRLTEINVKSLRALEYLDVSHNSLSTDLDYYTLSYSLKYLYASDNPELTVDPTDNSDYIEVDISNTATASMSLFYWEPKTLTSLNLAGTKLTGAIKLPGMTALQTLNVSNTAITSVDITDAAANGSIKKILAANSSLELVIVGPGNSLAEGVIEGVEDCGVLNVTNPTKDMESNIYNYISAFTAGNGATEKDFTINYAKTSKGFVINAGGEASITATAGRKVLKFFAIGVNGTPTVKVVRSSGKSILTKSTDSSSGGENCMSISENPLTVRNNAAAATDETKLLIDGDADWHKFNLGAQGNSSNNTEEGETITFRVTGNQGEKVIIFGINLSTSRDDEE